MKQMVCEMCGGTDLVKQDGVFVCQTCGTKYSVEEAKKMMIEGTVDVSGSTVKIDNTDAIENYFKMAENAYESSNYKETENYCNKIIEIDPDNYKAWLLKGRSAGWQSTLGNLRIEEAVNCFSKAIDNTTEEEKTDVKNDVASELAKLSFALVSLTCDNYAKNASQRNGLQIIDALELVNKYSVMLLVKCGVSGKDLKENIATKLTKTVTDAYQNDIRKDYLGTDGHPSKNKWDDYKVKSMSAVALLEYAVTISENKQANVQRYKKLIDIVSSVELSTSYTYLNGRWQKEYENSAAYKLELGNQTLGYHNKIKELDPTYEGPVITNPTSTSSKSGGCYVATAVYGSYDCPQVWTLRRYRDYGLAKTWYGRAFIHTYYAISPTLVKWFGHTEWFKKMWRGKLDSMVKKLRDRGYESTPYEDRAWK
jgi:hypothetical protein